MGGQYKFWDHYSVNVQGEYRDAGESDNVGLRLSQAYLDGRFRAGEDTILGANAGRIEIPFGLYNRTRDRVDTRPSILLPQSVYLEALGLRDFLLTGDGGMVYGLHALTEKSRFESKVSVARSSFGEVVDALLFSGWAEYSWDNRLRLRLTLLQSGDDETELSYPVLSAQYMWDRWTFTSEWGRLQFDGPFGGIGTNGIYGQVEYAVNEDISLFGRYDYLKFDLDLDVPITVEEDRLRAQSLAVGLGYNITDNVRVNVEYHMVDGKAFLNGAENPDIAEGPEKWNMVMVMGSLKF